MRRINDPCPGINFSIQFLLATPPSLSWNLEVLVDKGRPSKALDSCVAYGTTEIQGHRQVEHA